MWWRVFLFWSLGCEKEGAILTIMFSGYIFMTLCFTETSAATVPSPEADGPREFLLS